MSRFFSRLNISIPTKSVTSVRRFWCKPNCSKENEEKVCQVDAFCDPNEPVAVAVLRCSCGGLVDILIKNIKELRDKALNGKGNVVSKVGENNSKVGVVLTEMGSDVSKVGNVATVIGSDVSEEGEDSKMGKVRGGKESKHDTNLLEMISITVTYNWLFDNTQYNCLVKSDSRKAVNALNLMLKKEEMVKSFRPFVCRFLRMQSAIGTGVKMSNVSREETVEADMIMKIGGYRPYLSLLGAQRDLHFLTSGIEGYLMNLKGDVYISDLKCCFDGDLQMKQYEGDRTFVTVVFDMAFPDEIYDAGSYSSITLLNYLREVVKVKFMQHIQSCDLVIVKKVVVVGSRKVLKTISYGEGKQFPILTLRKKFVVRADNKFLSRGGTVVPSPEEMRNWLRGLSQQDYFKRTDQLIVFWGGVLRLSTNSKQL